MGGSLIHSKTFRVERYMGNDGKPHHEVLPDDGDYDFMSYSSWSEIKRYCAAFGIASEVWPDFTNYQDAIDVPLDAVAAKQGPFRRAIESLPAEAVARNDALARIVEYVLRGETVFFC
jgi:hypothetical protein